MGLRAPAVSAEGGGATLDAFVQLTDAAYGGAGLACDGTADWKAVLDAAVADVAATGGVVYVPPGRYGLSAPPAVPGSVKIKGAVNIFAGFSTPVSPTHGSIFVALAGFAPGAPIDTTESNGIMRFGSGAFPPNIDAGTADEDKTGGGAEDLVFDCRGLCNGPQTAGRRQILEKCWVVDPLKNGILLNGQNGRIDRCYVSCHGATLSNSIYVNNWDNKIVECQLRDHTDSGINARGNASGLEVHGGHIYSTPGGKGMKIVSGTTAFGPINLVGVVFDDPGDNNQIEVHLTGAGLVRGLSIVGCSFYKNVPFTATGTRSVLYMDPLSTASGIILTAVGNSVAGPGSGGTDFKAFAEKAAGTGTVIVSMAGNSGHGVLAVSAGFIAGGRAHSTFMVAKSGAITRGSGAGVASVANAGTIAHGLGAAPLSYSVTPTVAGRRVAVTAIDATTLTISLQDAAGANVAAAENVAWTAVA